MRDRSLPVATILSAGIAMGMVGDQLVRAPGGPGLNILLLAGGLAASVWIVSLTSPSPMSREALTWIAVGALFAGSFSWRGSELLHVGAFLAACVAFALPALEAGGAWVRRAGVFDLVEALVGGVLNSATGTIRLFSQGDREESELPEQVGTARTVARAALWGLLLAAGPLVVFGALFMSADPVFSQLIGDFVSVDLEAFASHVAVTGILSWLVCGYLVGVASGTRLTGIRRLAPARPSLSVAEVATAVGLVDLLFLAFVVVQFRYLFGGGAWVEITPGLTYAVYARAGFFQLVAAVALVFPWLLAADGLLGERSLSGRAVFRGLAGLHLVLLVAIVASALQRMLAYQAAYGLTELRVVVTAVLVWLSVLVLWFGATVLSGRRDRFVFGALVTGLVVVGSLQILDPVGLVARSNLDRLAETGHVDVEYLSSLGSDAVPVLATRIGELPAESRCQVAGRLIRHWGPHHESDWRSFNWSESRAKRVVEEKLATLQALLVPKGCDSGVS